MTRAGLRHVLTCTGSLTVRDGFVTQPHFDVYGPYAGYLRIVLPLDSGADHTRFLDYIYNSIGNHAAARGVLGHA